MQRLPEEIVANILTRLPVKKLLQIKCVCKLWNTTISDPQFAKLQLQQSNNNNKKIKNNNGNNFKLLVFPGNKQPICLDYENGDDQFGETKLDFPLGRHKLPIQSLGCCDGMFCLKFGDDILVWNPSIRQCRKLPTPFWPRRISYMAYGFGFDSAANDYKVYRAFREFGKSVFEVIALKTNCWRRVEISTSVFASHQSRNFLHGSLHWFNLSSYRDQNRFLAFSLATEKFLEVPLPDIHGVEFTEMVVFDGCLCVYCDDIGNTGAIEIWIMKEYMVRTSWTRLGTVIKDTIPNFVEHLTPLCYSSNGEILLEIDGKGVVKYNMNERSCTTVFNAQYDFIDFHHNAPIEALAYVESLVSPNHDDDGARPIVDGSTQ